MATTFLERRGWRSTMVLLGRAMVCSHRLSVQTSDVKWNQNLEAEVEANFWRLRPRPSPKTIMKKVPNNDNNIRFKIISGKITKIPEFYKIFARKNARLHNKTTRSRPRPRARPKFWPRGHFGLEDLTQTTVHGTIWPQFAMKHTHARIQKILKTITLIISKSQIYM